MERVGIERIIDVQLSIGRVDVDGRVVEQRWHGGVECPVPVGYTKGRRGCLVPASGRIWIASRNSLGVLPDKLLRS